MRGYELASPDVEKFGLLHVSGDVVPPEFFKAIKFDNGKPDLLAVLILSNFLYWYRPIKPRDERTDQPLRWRQRFAGTKLNRTYAELAEKYGATSRQVSDACHRLQKLQLVRITYSPSADGGTFTYFEPVFDSIKNLLKSESRPTPERESGIEPTHAETSVGIRSNVSRFTPERESHDKERARVEITCKTTKEREQNPRSHFVETKPANQPFSPNDDFTDIPPQPQWSTAERFVLKACNLWDELANQEKPVVETNWKTKQAVQAAGKYVMPRLSVENRIGGTPSLFREFWHDKLKREVAPRPDYLVEQWEAYDRWLVENYETHRRLSNAA